MKRISGGQLSRKAKATLLSSHAGDPRTAAGDTSFAGQAKQSTQHSRVSPEDLPDVTAQTCGTMTVTALSQLRGPRLLVSRGRKSQRISALADGQVVTYKHRRSGSAR